ncbi:DegV family protein [Alkaliphilus transvaalensis]|uniref:DegV family protein n=1 Tax=Alkaliphilus transvaalensis TaxID=114628 RepID=UPI00047CA75B|nr:DegV family protein [Alkaliphilus transvaalensis]
MIQIVTDSTCDLSLSLLNKFNILVVPMYLQFQNNTYKDGINISPEVIYEGVATTGELPVTAAPSSSDYYDIFKSQVDAGKEIIYIGTSSKLASAIQNAKIAANEFKDQKIKVIDSLNISTGLGLLVLQAAEYVKAGLDFETIDIKIRETVPKVRTTFIVDSLEYLRKGGRCTSLESIMGNMLGIKPMLHVIEGKLVLGEKNKGKREKLVTALLNQVIEDAQLISSKKIIIIHSIAHEEADYLKSEISRIIPDREVIILTAGCVIASHCGPSTIGINYVLKESPSTDGE